MLKWDINSFGNATQLKLFKDLFKVLKVKVLFQVPKAKKQLNFTKLDKCS